MKKAHWLTIPALALVGGLVKVLLLLVSASALTGCIGDQIEITGAGATFPAPIYARWRALYKREHPGTSVHYQAVGSGRGIKAITARDAEFGASDALLKASEERAMRAPLLAVPTVIGQIVLAYNLPQVSGEITLSGDTIAAIYLGEITRWNDRRLKAINPDVRLPDLPIRVAHRSDSSGTTHIFTSYLSAVSDSWREKAGIGKRIFWPTGNDWSGEGNDGVAHRILLQPGGIGYLELKYAQNAGLRYAALINRAGQRVWPTPESVQEAERNTPPSSGTYLKPSIVNAPGDNAYPIAAFTYLLVYRDLSYMEPGKAHLLVDFLRWILTTGQQDAELLHYTPLPKDLRDAVLEDIAAITLPPLPDKVGQESEIGAQSKGE